MQALGIHVRVHVDTKTPCNSAKTPKDPVQHKPLRIARSFGCERNQGVHIFNVAFDSWSGWGWDGGRASSEPRSSLACRMRSLTPSKCFRYVWWLCTNWRALKTPGSLTTPAPCFFPNRFTCEGFLLLSKGCVPGPHDFTFVSGFAFLPHCDC